MDDDRLVYIRTDGNEKIASGHLVRCLTIAEAIIDHGGKVHFLVSDETSREELLCRMEGREDFFSSHMKITVLGTEYQHPEQELSVVKQMLQEQENAVLLIDSYYVTKEYLLELQRAAKVYYLDDLQMFDYPVDGVINYDIRVNADFYQSAGAKYLEGKYAPLRKQFQDRDYRVQKETGTLLLTTGGTDPANLCGRFLKYFFRKQDSAGWTVHVVVGSMFANKQELEDLAASEKNVILHHKVVNMAELMEQCDLAVSAGGTTLFELCAVGVPTLSISVSKNQIPCNEAFAQAGIIPYEGNVLEENLVARLYAKVMELGSNLSERQRMSERQRKAVDGKGADRLAEILLEQ